MSAFNGSGTYVISGTGLPYVTNTTISSTVGNQLNTDLASGLSNVICKDGQTVITNNIPMAGFKLTGLGVATTSGDALSYGQPVTASTLAGTSLSLSGAIGSAFGATGVKLNSAAFTQTDSTTAAGTVGAAYGSEFGATTFATASNAITVTNTYGVYFKAPVAGSNVTFTNSAALGADSATINGTMLAQVVAASGASLNPLTVNSTATDGPVFTLNHSGTLRGQVGVWKGVIGSGSDSDFAINATTGKLGLAANGIVGISLDGTTAVPTLLTPILGTPTSGTLTNCTLPVGGVTGLGTGVATLLAGTPSGTSGLAGTVSPTFTGTVNTAATIATIGATGQQPIAIFENATAGTTTSGEIRIYNDQASNAHGAVFGITSSTYSGAFLTNGPTGEAAYISTGGAKALSIGTNFTTGITISTAQAIRMPAYGAGAATFDSSGNITSVSDETQKNIIGPYLATVDSIKPIIYKWREESGMETEHEYAGFSAQNCNAADSLMTGRTRDGLLTLQDRALLAAAVNSIHRINDRLTAAGIA